MQKYKPHKTKNTGEQAGQTVQFQLLSLWEKISDLSKPRRGPRRLLSMHIEEAENSQYISDGFAFSFACCIVFWKNIFTFFKKKKKEKNRYTTAQWFFVLGDSVYYMAVFLTH